MIKMAILGAGGIAAKMANTISEMDDVETYAVAARDLERAQLFADKYGFKIAYGSYEEMLEDEDVQLVYVATPHSHHFKHAKMSLQAGKHVLCEKAFTVNADQARELFALAKEKKLLITEAIWTRYMPSREIINDVIKSGVIGEVSSLTANLGYALQGIERIWNCELAGGALLDVGVYPINFALMAFHDSVKDIKADAIFKNGVDMMNSMTLTFEGDKMAVLHSCVNAKTNRMGVISGTKGYIEVTNINNPKMIRVYNEKYEEIASYLPPRQITGYEYEVSACIHAIENEIWECPEMPHSETIRVMEIMDEVRKLWNYKIPLLD